MELYVTPLGGTRTDLTELCKTVTWSGSYRQCAREVRAEILSTNADDTFPRPDIPLGSVLELEEDGESLFYGTVVTRRGTTSGHILTLNCLDKGQSMRSEAWYAFRNITPEAAVATIAGDFGIELGEIAQTGAKITRKFPGVSLYRIIATLYTKAGETTGKRYMVGFRGKKLCVWEKVETSDLVLAPRHNLMDASVTEDISNLCNRVAIYSEEGKQIRVIDNDEAVALYGAFQHIITQRKGKDAAAEAKAYLEDNDVVQTISVDCLGDVRLVAGKTVQLRDNATGVTGLFWIDADAHTWKNGQHFTGLDLNFRNLMDEMEAGREK